MRLDQILSERLNRRGGDGQGTCYVLGGGEGRRDLREILTENFEVKRTPGKLQNLMEVITLILK